VVSDPETDALLAEQIQYYQVRAPEYDAWLQRLGGNHAWLAEVARVGDVLRRFGPYGHVLELAAGTGAWTERLAPLTATLTAVDSSPAALRLNRAKLASSPTPVRHIEADIFTWEPDRRYDVVCFFFWFSHVPISRLDAFWGLVDRALTPGGRFFFVDNAPPRQNLPVPGWRPTRRGSLVREPDALTDLATGVSTRRLSDDREYRIVKRFWEPAELQQQLRQMGWRSNVHSTDWAFIYGSGERETD
jgi:SAM-dependent methyltransferase